MHRTATRLIALLQRLGLRHLAPLFISSVLVGSDTALCQQEQASAREFLEAGEALLYHPDSDGLTYLAFDVPRYYAPGKRLWVVNIIWSAKEGAKFGGEISSDAPLPEPMKEQLRKNFAILGEPFLAQQLNRYSTRLLLTSVAAMAGTENGLTKVRYVPKLPGKDNFREKVLYFDQKRILRRATTTTSDGSILLESFSWKPVQAGNSLLVLDAYTSEATLGDRTLTRVTTHNYERFGKWLLQKGASIKTKSLPDDLSRQDSAFANQDLVFTNIVAK